MSLGYDAERWAAAMQERLEDRSTREEEAVGFVLFVCFGCAAAYHSTRSADGLIRAQPCVSTDPASVLASVPVNFGLRSLCLRVPVLLAIATSMLDSRSATSIFRHSHGDLLCVADRKGPVRGGLCCGNGSAGTVCFHIIRNVEAMHD